MTSGIQFEQGEIWLVPFPFSNFASSKKRPVLIISNETYNNSNSDILVCQITSQKEVKNYSISLSQKDLKSGNLVKPSQIRCDKINILEKTLFQRKFSKINDSKFDECVFQIKKLVDRPKTIQDSLK